MEASLTDIALAMVVVGGALIVLGLLALKLRRSGRDNRPD